MAKNTFNAKQAALNNADYTGAIATGQRQQAQGFSNLGQAFSQQQQTAQRLQAQAAGTGGPSMADATLKSGAAQSAAEGAGAAASQRLMNPALSARTAITAAANPAVAAAAGNQRIKEQQTAAGELTGAETGEAGTAGGMTNAGGNVFGTAAGANNTANANLITNNNDANQINESVAAENASAINSGIGSLVNSVGGAAAMFAKGGEVKKAPLMKSIAEQIAHHMMVHGHNSMMAEGGPVPAAVSPVEEVKDDKTRKEGDVEKKKALETQKNETSDFDALAADAGTKKMATGGDVVEPMSFSGGTAAQSAPFSAKYDADPFGKKPGSTPPTPKAGGSVAALDVAMAPAPVDSSAANSAIAPLSPVAPGMAHGGLAMALAGGGVPGAVKDPGKNKYADDTVKTMLSPGEIVLPKSVSGDPEASARFVAKILAEKKKKKPAGKLSEALA
jgi:hypothetical protein